MVQADPGLFASQGSFFESGAASAGEVSRTEIKNAEESAREGVLKQELNAVRIALQDIETARRLGMPVYTVSRVGIWKADRDGRVIPVDDARWWVACSSGACGLPERDPEFRSASAPSETRNLGAESTYR